LFWKTHYTVGGARDSIFFEVNNCFSLSLSLSLLSRARVIDCTMGSDACSIICSPRTRAADKERGKKKPRAVVRRRERTGHVYGKEVETHEQSYAVRELVLFFFSPRVRFAERRIRRVISNEPSAADVLRDASRFLVDPPYRPIDLTRGTKRNPLAFVSTSVSRFQRRLFESTPSTCPIRSVFATNSEWRMIENREIASGRVIWYVTNAYHTRRVHTQVRRARARKAIKTRSKDRRGGRSVHCSRRVCLFVIFSSSIRGYWCAHSPAVLDDVFAGYPV